jgi:hypothetical protein
MLDGLSEEGITTARTVITLGNASMVARQTPPTASWRRAAAPAKRN